MIRLLFYVACFALGSGFMVALRKREWVLFASLLALAVLMCVNARQIITVLSGGAS